MPKTNEIRIDFLEMILVLTRWKKTIILSTTLIVIAAILYALFSTPQYTAQTVVIPKEDNIDVMSSFMKNMPISKSQFKGNIFSPATDLENVYIGILKSRTLQINVIQQFDLASVYKLKKGHCFIEDVLGQYNQHVSCGITDEGMLNICVEDENPKRAAEIANYITTIMNQIYGNLAVETARNKRIFLGERLEIIKHDMTACEDSLTQFQINNHVADLDQQAKATIEAGESIEAKLLEAQLELNIAKKNFTQDNQKIREMEMNLAEMKKQSDALTDSKESNLLLSLKTAPNVALQFFRFKRNMKIQEMLFELIMQQYEAAKLEEAKNTPQIQILDRATAPEKRSKPKRTRIVITAFLASIVFNFLLINLTEIYKRMRQDNSESYQKIVMIFKNLLPSKQ